MSQPADLSTLKVMVIDDSSTTPFSDIPRSSSWNATAPVRSVP